MIRILENNDVTTMRRPVARATGEITWQNSPDKNAFLSVGGTHRGLNQPSKKSNLGLGEYTNRSQFPSVSKRMSQAGDVTRRLHTPNSMRVHDIDGSDQVFVTSMNGDAAGPPHTGTGNRPKFE